MRESEERVVRLPEDDPDVFSEVVHWLYERKLNVEDEFDTAIATIAEAADQDLPMLPAMRPFHKLTIRTTRLFYLAQKLMVEQLQNDTIDIILVKVALRNTLSFSAISRIVQAQEGDILYEWLTLHLACRMGLEGGYPGWRKAQERTGRETLKWARRCVENMELVAAAAAASHNAKHPSTETNKCKWHIHVDTPKCT